MTSSPQINPITLNFHLKGMSCASCVRHVEKALSHREGVLFSQVNLGTESVELHIDPQKAHITDIVQSLQKIGYEPVIETTQFLVKDMTCAACVARVEKVISRIPNVMSVSVNLANNKATVKSLGSIDLSSLFQIIQKIGFKPEAILSHEKNSEESIPSDKKELFHALAALLFSAPLALPMLLIPFGIHWMPSGWVQFLLALPVQFWFGARFYRSGWKALKSGSGTMDLLVALGTSAAFFFSLYQLVVAPSEHSEPHLYFEASAVVIALVLVGKYLEARAKRKTAEALYSLIALKPLTAWIKRGREEKQVSIAEVKIDDIVIIKPGERIPVDGIITEGQTEIDEALITGESMPVSKEVGDNVITGSINGTGRLLVETKAVGSDTTLAKIIHMVEGAQSSKAPIQKLVDQVASIFVPVVIAIALLTFLVNWIYYSSSETALLRAVAVLVIACPCALGLATPTAIMAGTGIAARFGILIKDAETLERANTIKVVGFDKTGTLTEGKPTLTQYKNLLSEKHPDSVLEIASSLQKGSEHPLACAILQKADSMNISPHEVQNISAVPGRGIKGSYEGKIYHLGSARYMQEIGVSLNNIEPLIQKEQKNGATLSYLAYLEPEPELLAFFAFSDQPRKNSANAITALKNRHILPVMITGDTHAAAETIAKQLGINIFRSDVLPEDKVSTILELKQNYGNVAMVGDGVNDAPALAAADLGIAMGSGTDAAMEAAGMTLMRSDPQTVVDALDIAHQTQRKIKQNLFWAFIYNCMGIPLAACGFLSPTLAGAAMAFSSVSVVTNALLLRFWKPKQD